MRCRDFHEIADSYLSGELLVETNHEVFRHLESCENCRTELAVRRELRSQLRSAVMNFPESKINPVFAARLRADLRRDFSPQSNRKRFWRGAFAVKTLATTTAVLFVVVLIGFASLATQKTPEHVPGLASNLPQPEPAKTDVLRTIWREISLQAIGDHKHCALENMAYWEKISSEHSIQKANFRENILSRAEREFSEKIELLHVHDCEYEGRIFRHAVMKIGRRVVSVLLTESEIAGGADKSNQNQPDSTIVCQKQTGFQVASFAGNNRAVFVISDMSETENLSLARSLSNIMQS